MEPISVVMVTTSSLGNFLKTEQPDSTRAIMKTGRPERNRFIITVKRARFCP